MVNEIVIISMPDAKGEQLTNLTYALEAEGNLPFPVYVTQAKLEPITKQGVLDWIETLVKISMKEGWHNDLSDRLKNMQE